MCLTYFLVAGQHEVALTFHVNSSDHLCFSGGPVKSLQKFYCFLDFTLSCCVQLLSLMTGVWKETSRFFGGEKSMNFVILLFKKSPLPCIDKFNVFNCSNASDLKQGHFPSFSSACFSQSSKTDPPVENHCCATGKTQNHIILCSQKMKGKKEDE